MFGNKKRGELTVDQLNEIREYARKYREQNRARINSLQSERRAPGWQKLTRKPGLPKRRSQMNTEQLAFVRARAKKYHATYRSRQMSEEEVAARRAYYQHYAQLNVSKMRKWRKAWYLRNKDRIAEQNRSRLEKRREAYASNKAVHKERNRQKYLRHRDQYLASRKLWREENPGSWHAYAAKRPDVVKAVAMNRRARKKAGGILRAADILAVRSITNCEECGVHLMLWKNAPHSHDAFTIGHLVPLVRGGKNDRANLIAQCWKCNMRQGSRISALTKKAPPTFIEVNGASLGI